jgi:hypothetical protein
MQRDRTIGNVLQIATGDNASHFYRVASGFNWSLYQSLSDYVEMDNRIELRPENTHAAQMGRGDGHYVHHPVAVHTVFMCSMDHVGTELQIRSVLWSHECQTMMHS